MDKRWYENIFNWLAIWVFAFALYYQAYALLGGKVVGLADYAIRNMGIPEGIVIGGVGVIQGICMIGIVVIPLIILWVWINHLKTRWFKKRQMNQIARGASLKRKQIISDISLLFDTIESMKKALDKKEATTEENDTIPEDEEGRKTQDN